MKTCRAGMLLGLLGCVSTVYADDVKKTDVFVPPLLNPSPSPTLQQGREALRDKRFADAARLLEKAADDKAGADEALLLLGNAQLYSKNYGAAIAAYDRLLNQAPDSPWNKKARFQKADAYIAQKNWKAAAAIYEPELEYITSQVRREQVAATYLKYADDYFTPGQKAEEQSDESARELAKPKLARSKSLYLKAVEIGLAPSRQSDVLLRAALSDFYAKNYSESINGFARVTREYPDSPAGVLAQYYNGVALLRAGALPQSRRALRDFLRDHADHEKRRDAAFALLQTFQMPSPPNDRALALGAAAIRDFLQSYPDHPRAVEVESWLGLAQYNRGHQEDAAREWEAFLARHRNDDSASVALSKFNLGNAYLKQKKFDQAIATWERFLAEHPVHSLWNNAQRLVIDTYYQIGEEAYKNKKYEDAQKAWEAFAQKYPLDVRNADIMFRLGMMLHDAKKYDEALTQWRKAISKYGGTEAASRAQYMIALTLEKQGKWDDAFTALKSVQGKWQSDAQTRLTTLKTRRMAVFTERSFTTREAPALKIVTRGVTKVELRAYKVDLREYFSRKNTINGVDDLDLNLIAPDERWTQDIKVKDADYSPYREIETQVPVPAKGAGVWAVICRAVNDDEASTDNSASTSTLEAASVVFVTDVSIITKSTKNDVLVWAENLVTQQPVAGAQVLISNGDKIVKTGVTDADGSFHYQRGEAQAGDEMEPGEEEDEDTAVAEPTPTPKPAKTKGKPGKTPKKETKPAPAPKPAEKPEPFPTGSLRVLVAKEGHYASTETNLQGVAQVASLLPSGLLYSDRPLYRAGQKVQLTGIVRQVKDGLYAFEPGAEYSLSVQSPSGTNLLSRKIHLDEWGSFKDSLTLAADAPPGVYRVALVRPAKTEGGQIQQPFGAGGFFQVAAYQLDKIRLKIDVEKNVYLRGEDIKGTVTVRYFSGEPLRQRKVRFAFSGDNGKDYTTSDKGEFTFSIPTRNFDEDQSIALSARYEEEGAQARSVVYLSSVGASASLSTVRDVYLTGEQFQVNVSARDLAGKPVAGDWKLRALKIEKSQEFGDGEREMATQPVSTDKSGDATAQVALKESGNYILRLEGKDSNGNPVISEMAVLISGEDDDVRLRILADTDSLKSGTDAKIRLLWRGAKDDVKTVSDTKERLALVTYEADRILGKQLVRLAPGESTLSVPIQTRLAPLFRLSVALLDSDDLHQASKWFAVERDLKIDVVAERADGKPLKDATMRPGEKVRVKITTRDSNGKPVAALLNVSAIDASLWQRAAATGGAPAPIAALWGARYVTNNPVWTNASNTFNFSTEARQKVLSVREAENFSRSLLADSKEYPDVPLDSWTYAAINRLSSAGIIEGYPNGTYSGGRAMTRYEMAMGVARAVQNSQNLKADGNKTLLDALAREFKNELDSLGVRNENLTSSASLLQRAGAANYINSPYLMKSAVDPATLRSWDSVFAGASVTVRDYDPDEQFGDDNEAVGHKYVLNAPAGLQGAAGATGPIGASRLDLDVRYGSYDAGAGGFDGGGFARGAGIGGMVSTGFAMGPYLNLPDRSREDFSETAFWDPAVLTNEKGETTVEFTLPDSLTEWRIAARGLTKDTRVSEAETKVTASKDYWVELQAPPLLQAGDTSNLVAVLHNNSDKDLQAQVNLDVRLDGQAAKPMTVPVTVPANNTALANFEVNVPDAAKAELKLTSTAAEWTDGETKTIPVRAWGVERTASKSGVAQDDRTVEIALPESDYSSRHLHVTIAPVSPTALYDMLERGNGNLWGAPLAPTLTSRLMALCQAAGYLKEVKSEATRYERYSHEIESLVNRLNIAQNQDGGWSWSISTRTSPHAKLSQRNNNGGDGGDPRPSDLLTSAEAMVALAMARDLGIKSSNVPLTDANQYLTSRFASANDDDKALIVWAQTTGGYGEFAYLNRLYRSRNSLGSPALAKVALSLKMAGRDEMAREVLDLLLDRTSEQTLRAALQKPVEIKGDNALDINDPAVVALTLWTVAQVQPSNALLPPLSELLWSKVEGGGWPTSRASGYAIAGLLRSYDAQKRQPEKYTLAISVDGTKVKTLEVNSDASRETVVVPITKDNAKVELDMEGRGAYTYSVVMDGFTSTGLLDDATYEALEAKDKDASETLRNTTLQVWREYRPSMRTWKNRAVPAGYSTVTNAKAKKIDANEVRIGGRVNVNLRWGTYNFEKSSIGDTVVLREPLAAGTRLMEETINGNYDRYEIGDRSLTLYFRSGTSGYASYTLAGAQTGAYRIPPAKAWSWDKPGLYAISTYKKFKVIPRDETGTDVYPLTADELYYIGKWSYDRAQEAIAKGEEPEAEDIQTAEKDLGDLFNRDADPKDWKLTDAAGRDVSRMLFSLALRKDDAPGTVRFFEALRERYPDLVIPFPEVVATAKAYGKLGEVEREVQVLKATAEASFRRETGVAGTLVEEGEDRAAYDYLARQAQQYPDLANVQSSVYTLAQSIASRSTALRKEGESSNNAEKKKQSEEFGRLAAGALSDFLVIYPEHPLTDEASFAYAVNLTEQGKFDDAVKWAARSRALYAGSSYLDDFDYIATYASFLGEKYEDALKLAGVLASTEYPQPRGDKAKSTYRPFALYIAAQIHHARGETSEALELYRQVSNQFPDAAETADSFDEKSLRMPEVVVAHNDAPLQVKVTGRNIEKATVAVYKVDLLRFYQERRNLLGLAEMNLAGIAPAWEGTIDFGATRFVDIEKTITLPLAEKGAYFMTVRADGGEPLVSGVAVRSSLKMEVQEDSTSGRVRVNLARIETGSDKKQTSQVAPKAEIWAAGSAGNDFRKGTTDLRGLVALDGLQGRVTVIAFQNGEYAFYRGEQALQNASEPRPAKIRTSSPAKSQAAEFKDQARGAYMTNQEEITNRNTAALNGAMQGGQGANSMGLQVKDF